MCLYSIFAARGYTCYSIHSFIHLMQQRRIVRFTCLQRQHVSSRAHTHTNGSFNFLLCHSVHTHRYFIPSFISWFVNVFVAIAIAVSISFSHACVRASTRVCACVFIQVYDMMCCSLSGRLNRWICVYANCSFHISLWFLYLCITVTLVCTPDICISY